MMFNVGAIVFMNELSQFDEARITFVSLVVVLISSYVVAYSEFGMNKWIVRFRFE